MAAFAMDILMRTPYAFTGGEEDEPAAPNPWPRPERG